MRFYVIPGWMNCCGRSRSQLDVADRSAPIRGMYYCTISIGPIVLRAGDQRVGERVARLAAKMKGSQLSVRSSSMKKGLIRLGAAALWLFVTSTAATASLPGRRTCPFNYVQSLH